MRSGPPAFVACVLTAVPAVPSVAAPELSADISVSTSTAKKPAPIEFKFGYREGSGAKGRETVGASGGLSEGKPLEVLLWGSGGAVAGSLAGPVGTVIGAAVGALSGYIVGSIYGPKKKRRRGGP